MSENENLVARLLKSIGRAEDGAGTLPAKMAVKLHPDDWRAVCRLGRDTAAALTAAEARIKALGEALGPMAAVASDIPDEWDDNHQCVTACGHFRRARQALSTLGGNADDR